MEETRRVPVWLLWAVAAAVLVLDFITKHWALSSLAHSASRAVLGDFLRFTITKNTGVAFGLLADQKLPLGWISVIALIAVLWLAFRPSARVLPRAFALGLILGGAVGNLIDRVRWGSVVDFIDVGIGTLRWPVFNIADSAITVGVVIWSLQLLFSNPRHSSSKVAEVVPAKRTADDVRGP